MLQNLFNLTFLIFRSDIQFDFSDFFLEKKSFQIGFYSFYDRNVNKSIINAFKINIKTPRPNTFVYMQCGIFHLIYKGRVP